MGQLRPRELRAGWYLNITVKVRQTPTATSDQVLGIDLGLKTAATASNGDVLAAKHYHQLEKQLATAQRARKKDRVRAISAKIRNQRKDALHKFTTALVNDYGAIFIGNVSTAWQTATGNGKSVLDAGWGELKTQLQYKGERAGRWVEVVNEAYTTQTCSARGARTGPKGREGLGTRAWECPCGASHDRDVNAAINIAMAGLVGVEERVTTARLLREAKAVKVAPLDTLLLNMGSEGGTANLTDLASHTVTKGSTWVASTAQAKFGTSSGYFTRFSELTVPYSSDFQFEGDFTLEGWANVSATQANWQFLNGADTGIAGPIVPLIGHGNPFSGAAAPLSSASNFDFGIDASTSKMYFARRTGAGQAGKFVTLSNAIPFAYNSWHHYAVSRAGSTLYFAFDGAVVGTATLAGPLNVASSLPVTIGRTRGGDDQLFNWLNGYVQDVRITKGYARYVAPYTPPGAMTLYE